jgi:hypothetical protein
MGDEDLLLLPVISVLSAPMRRRQWQMQALFLRRQTGKGEKMTSCYAGPHI